MRCVDCLCGLRVDAADADALSADYWSHVDTAHADFPISQRRRNDADDALRRTGGWDGERRPLDDEVEIVALRPELKDDYLRFFDLDAFADNPAWASCYCIAYTIDVAPVEFDERGAATNRAERAAQIERGEATGVLAHAGDQVVGWCHAALRTKLPLLDRTPGFEAEDAATSGAIVCYVIAPGYRGQGLARRLLDGACEMLRDGGLSAIYGYPPASARTAASSYHGRLDMYVDAGFERVRGAGRHVVMRKAL